METKRTFFVDSHEYYIQAGHKTNTFVVVRSVDDIIIAKVVMDQNTEQVIYDILDETGVIGSGSVSWYEFAEKPVVELGEWLAAESFNH
tara:strand:- start:305 stop:571 length:267 start_codon:yes stop_codon:yes gene_type:complete